MRTALLARTPASAFPWSASLNPRNDIDHTIPYQPDGPPGQTRLDNLGPHGRSEHRYITAKHIRHRQPEPGTYIW